MRPIRHLPSSHPLTLLAYPAPYRCWVTLSNDPDRTTMANFQALHDLIWDELQLPFGDTFFLQNFNEDAPDQVSVASHPQVLQTHPHDTMHTWGDYCCTSTKMFNRNEAERSLELMRDLKVSPRVWTDHHNFAGNILHNARAAHVPQLIDASGLSVTVPEYSLDLIHQAGVRYLWDGTITPVIGQDRPVNRLGWYANSPLLSQYVKAAADLLGRPIWKRVDAKLFDYHPTANRQYRARTFADGNRFYTFQRYGKWKLADIQGFGELLQPADIDKLIQHTGTQILYTHLGKRPGSMTDKEPHVPAVTEQSLRHLQQRFQESKVMVSSTSKMLDYLVLRDHAEMNEDSINFQADGIRFDTLTPADLRGHAFGVRAANTSFRICCAGEPVDFEASRLDDQTYRCEILA